MAIMYFLFNKLLGAVEEVIAQVILVHDSIFIHYYIIGAQAAYNLYIIHIYLRTELNLSIICRK